MRFYGTIETNLVTVLKNSCKGKDLTDIGYSIDSLMFETPDGQTFNIDFEEGDYAVEETSLTFRLKSLGITFEENWVCLGTTEGIDFENDYDFFRVCDLKSISLYLPEDVSEFVKKLKFEVSKCELFIGNDSISYDATNVEVEV